MHKKSITQILQEATKDILTEDTLKSIEDAFNTAVNEKVQIHVEQALIRQDEEYAAKLEALLEAIDKDHTKKLQNLVEAIDKDRTQKLKQVIDKYETALHVEATKMHKTLISQISDFLDIYLDQKIPIKAINEAVFNRRAINLLNEMRKILGVDAALAKESIKSAVLDGKRQIAHYQKLAKKYKTVCENRTKDLIETKKELFLEQKTKDLDDRAKRYVLRSLQDKSYDYIIENFDYVVDLFKKNEAERKNSLKAEAIRHSSIQKAIKAAPSTKVLTEQVNKPVETPRVSTKAYMEGF